MIPLSWIPPERLPAALLVLMPGRYLNFGAMTFVALLIGLLGSRRELWSRLVLLFLTCGLLAGDHSMLWEFLEHHHHVRYQSNIRPLTSCGWQRPRCSRAPHGRARERRTADGSRTQPLHLHPLHPLHLSHLLRLLVLVVLDDDASARRALGRAFQRPHERRVLRRRRRALGRAARRRRSASHSVAHAAAGAPRQRARSTP